MSLQNIIILCCSVGVLTCGGLLLLVKLQYPESDYTLYIQLLGTIFIFIGVFTMWNSRKSG